MCLTELDKAVKDKKCNHFPKDFSCEVYFKGYQEAAKGDNKPTQDDLPPPPPDDDESDDEEDDEPLPPPDDDS